MEPSASDEEEAGDGNSPSIGVIVGAVAGGAVVVALAAVAGRWDYAKLGGG